MQASTEGRPVHSHSRPSGFHVPCVRLHTVSGYREREGGIAKYGQDSDRRIREKGFIAALLNATTAEHLVLESWCCPTEHQLVQQGDSPLSSAKRVQQRRDQRALTASVPCFLSEARSFTLALPIACGVSILRFQFSPFPLFLVRALCLGFQLSIFPTSAACRPRPMLGTPPH